MKKVLSIILSITMVFSMSTLVFADGSATFSDVAGHWAQETIYKWSNHGAISGYPDGTFRPDATITRAEASKILACVFKLAKAESLEYDDIDATAWYYPYVECAAKYIPSYALPIGYEANVPFQTSGERKFFPELDAMRAHIAEALVEIKLDNSYNITHIPSFLALKDNLSETFMDPEFEETFGGLRGDFPQNQQRLFKYVYLANELEIMMGDAEGYFRPYHKITRAEFLTVVDRVYSDISRTHTLYHIYLNQDAGYSVKIPDTWNDKYMITEYSESGNFSSTFIHKATFEKYGEGMGRIFTISKYKFDEEQIYDSDNREIVHRDEQYVYVLELPTDAQSPSLPQLVDGGIEVAEEYEQMYRDIKFIRDSFKLIDDIQNEIEYNEVSVFYGENELTFESKPFFYNHSVYVPLDEFWIGLGLDKNENNKYTYDNGKITIWLDGHSDYYEINIGENNVKYDAVDLEAVNDKGVREVRNAPILLDGEIYIPYDVYALNIFNRYDHFYDVSYIFGDINSKKIYLENAEQLTYSNICDMQFDVDNGHYPWRLDAIEVIKWFAELKNLGGGTIKDLAGGERVSADYVLGDTVYDIELIKPINKTEQGIWIVERFEKTEKPSSTN